MYLFPRMMPRLKLIVPILLFLLPACGTKAPSSSDWAVAVASTDACDEGEERVNGQCVPVCDDDQVRDDEGNCCAEDEQDAEGICPACEEGEERVDGQCVPVCDEDQVRDDEGNCCEEDEQDAEGICPACEEGEERVDGQCVPVCDEDQVRDDEGNCCQEDEQDAEGICPACEEGEERVDGQCVPECDEDQVRDDEGSCCAEDEQDSEGMCPECEEGEERVDGQCVPECDEEQVRDDDGNCCAEADQDSEDMCPECEEGEERIDGQCVPECEEDEERNEDGECEPTKCPAGDLPDENGYCQYTVTGLVASYIRPFNSSVSFSGECNPLVAQFACGNLNPFAACYLEFFPGSYTGFCAPSVNGVGSETRKPRGHSGAKATVGCPLVGGGGPAVIGATTRLGVPPETGLEVGFAGYGIVYGTDNPTYQIQPSRLDMEWFGRPNAGPNGIAAIATDPSRGGGHIWSKLAGDIECDDGALSVTSINFAVSRFPSHTGRVRVSANGAPWCEFERKYQQGTFCQLFHTGNVCAAYKATAPTPPLKNDLTNSHVFGQTVTTNGSCVN